MKKQDNKQRLFEVTKKLDKTFKSLNENLSSNEFVLNEEGSGSPINNFVMFGYNYPPDFIEQVWADDPRMAQHFKEKFGTYYEKYGSNGVMNAFYVNLSGDHQRKLEDWIQANYKG